MRNLLKIVAVLLFVTASATVNAQTLQFGHIDLEELISVMPEFITAQAVLEKYQTDLEEVHTELIAEYQKKLAEYNQLIEADASEVRINAKEDEIREIYTRIDNFSNNASMQMEQRQAELLQPILIKAETAIEEVAKAQGFIYVFNSNALHYKSNSSIDILPMVKEKLGIK